MPSRTIQDERKQRNDRCTNAVLLFGAECSANESDNTLTEKKNGREDERMR